MMIWGGRVRKTGSTTQDYFYDGLDIAAEFTGGDWTTATGRYVHGPGVDTPLIRVANGTPNVLPSRWVRQCGGGDGWNG